MEVIRRDSCRVSAPFLGIIEAGTPTTAQTTLFGSLNDKTAKRPISPKSTVGFMVKTSKPYAAFHHGIRLFDGFDLYDPDKNGSGTISYFPG